jgi:hypothetical protein
MSTDQTPMLPDGTYHVFVVDADERDDGQLEVSLTILTGEHKSEVLDLVATGLDRDPIDLIGMPGTLEVTGGEPRFTVDDV